MKTTIMILVSLLFTTSAFGAVISEAEARRFLDNWLTAQNTGSYSDYAAMYSESFTGIRKSGPRTLSLNHDAWLNDRKRMFKKKMTVTASKQVILVTGTTAKIKFEQKWESDTYKDKGEKVLHLAKQRGILRLEREEMLSSTIAQKIKPLSTVKEIKTTANDEHNRKLTLKSQFTSIKEKECTEKLPKTLSRYFDKTGTYAVKCPPLKKWQPFIVSADDRSWIELFYDQSIWTTESKVVYESFGHFPYVGGDYIEWRTNEAGNPQAVIFRVIAQDPNSMGHISKFYVISLTEHTPSFCGIVKTNEEARGMTENLENCVEMLPNKQLDR